VGRKRVKSLQNGTVEALNEGYRVKLWIRTRDRSKIWSGFHSHSASSAFELFQLSVLLRDGVKKTWDGFGERPFRGVRG
jgi:hypothetical protein